MPLNRWATTTTWEIKLPYALAPNQSYDWLEPVAKMRGCALYENGLRPFFKINDDEYYDKDNFEYDCYHILAKINNEIIGCIRLLPLINSLECVTSEIVGKDNFRIALLESLKSTDKLAEVNRWVVHPNHQNTLVGYYLGYAVWALAKHLGYQFFANGGLKSNKLFTYYGGAYPLKNSGPYYSEKYNDNVYILYFDENKLSTKAKSLIKKMERLLFHQKPLLPPLKIEATYN